ncbi:DinB family protein [Paenibacillus sp. N1-5-1-14]|uniref:DinB family protein n=1 Tax=Paenibacillus radicibacter TaxID=2972488 RepID=UPI00215964C8|nr:DinB family protein [Paenibacillus radicibacter]MCR8644386.1 DinB family protein [Paenibacillus radicibacter]
MEQVCTRVFNQIRVGVDSIQVIMEQLSEVDLDYRFTPDKRSVRELLSHISILCRADFLIMNEATQEQMSAFYKDHSVYDLQGMETQLQLNFEFVKEAFAAYSEEELSEIKRSYWGVSYSRYEWLLQILGHVYHHRAQLHTMLVAKGAVVKVNLFE